MANHRSLKSLDLRFPPSGVLVLVGPNNAGKSNVIRSIDALCGDLWFGRDKIDDHDHYQRDRDRPVSITLDFDDGRSAHFASDERWPHSYYDPNGRRISGQVKDDFPCVYLGADRTFDKHLSFYDWTLIGKIRRSFHQKAGPVRDQLDLKFRELVDIFNQVPGFEAFKADFSRYFTELQADTGAQLSIDFQPYTPSNYFKTLQIVAEEPSSGRHIDLAELGEGSRNVALLALLRSYAKNLRAAGEEAVGLLALEEPEIYMHPQAQRHLRATFRAIADAGMQVVVSSHSAEFVDTEEFESIARVRKVPDPDREGWMMTQVVTVSKQDLVGRCVATGVPRDKVTDESIGPFYRTTANPRLNDGFFARVLLLVEGDTEELALPVYLEHIGLPPDLLGITPVGVQGKNQIPKYWRLYGAFAIPMIVMFDNDDDGSGAKRASNRNLASCFGLTLDEILSVQSPGARLRSANDPTTDLIVVSPDFEQSLRADFAAWNGGDPGPIDRLEAEARALIRPIRDQSKGQIARHVARGLCRDHPDFQPQIIGSLVESLRSLGVAPR